MIYLYYFIATIALAFIDNVRIRQAPITHPNIQHWVSAILAVTTAVIIWFFSPNPYTWASLLFIPGFTAVRALVYDLALNKMRGLEWSYTSSTTSAETDSWLKRLGFWQIRLIALIVLVIVLIVQYIFI